MLCEGCVRVLQDYTDLYLFNCRVILINAVFI